MRDVKRLNILGQPVDALTFDRALTLASELAQDHEKTSYIVAVNPEKIMTARRSKLVSDFLHNADLAIPDGIGVVVAARLLYGEKLERVAGADLMQELCRVSGSYGLKLFLYGSKEEVNASAAKKLKERFPDVDIVGRQDGYLPEDEYGTLVERINASGADVLFLALGSPMQENWMNRYGASLKVGVCMGIGGTLDTIAGAVKRAPLGWQKARLEWLYRLLRQPTRFWRQRKIFIFASWIVFLKLTGYGRRRKSTTL